MTARREVLFLAHRIPYPPDKGDKIRSWRLLKFLAERFDVHLCCFVDDPDDFRHAQFLEDQCASATLIPLHSRWAQIRSARAFLGGGALSLDYYNDRAMTKAVRSIRRRPLAAEIVFSSTMAQYIEKPVPGRPRLVDFCDADSEKFIAYAGSAQFPMNAVYAREGRRLAKTETAIANWADASFAITGQEAEIFNRRVGAEKPVGWWSNGVDTDDFNPDAELKPVSEPAEIVFTGAMDYRANVEAALFFVREVWPLVREAAPDASFAIVGARPAASLKALHGRDGVRVTGRIDDIRPWIAGARLAVAPLRVARGLQNKVLEAMAMGRPVVATPTAATGIVAAPGEHLLIAETAQEQAAATLGLLRDQSQADRIGAAARAHVAATYRWDVQLSRFSDALEASLSGSSPS